MTHGQKNIKLFCMLLGRSYRKPPLLRCVAKLQHDKLCVKTGGFIWILFYANVLTFVF